MFTNNYYFVAKNIEITIPQYAAYCGKQLLEQLPAHCAHVVLVSRLQHIGFSIVQV